MIPAIELCDVTKSYGRVTAVDRLSLEVPEGALFGLIGPNGAGKTTTFGLLSGFLRPTAGEVRVRGVPLLPGHPPLGRVLSLPQDALMPGRLTGLAVLKMLGRLGGLSAKDAEERSLAALSRVGLADEATRRIQALSHGQRRRVGIASTLIGDDEVILLDEPTAGLDPRTAGELKQLMLELVRHRTVVVSSHNLLEIEAMCTHAAIIDRGRLVASGTMDEMRGTGSIVEVSFARSLVDPEVVLASLRAIDGIRSASVGNEALSIHLELGGDAKAAEGLTNEVLRILIEKGASVKSVERGKSLEQRFMEETGKGSSAMQVSSRGADSDAASPREAQDRLRPTGTEHGS